MAGDAWPADISLAAIVARSQMILTCPTMDLYMRWDKCTEGRIFLPLRVPIRVESTLNGVMVGSAVSLPTLGKDITARRSTGTAIGPSLLHRPCLIGVIIHFGMVCRVSPVLGVYDGDCTPIGLKRLRCTHLFPT